MNKKYIILFVTLVSSYLITILLIPHYISDDFYIFTTISNNPRISLPFNEKLNFFLSSRPVSYFSFWIDYILIGNNPVLMKVHTIILAIIVIILLIKIFKKINNFYTSTEDEHYIIMLLSVLLLHPDFLMSIYWISNRTEILTFMFYLFSIFFLLRWIEFNNPVDRGLILISYLLSILAKQSSVHLPLVLLVFYYLFNGDTNLRKAIFKFLPEITIALIFTIMSVYNYVDESQLAFINIWKKPFSVIGILLYSFNIHLGDLLYNYFILNKELAALGLVIVVVLLALIFRSNRSKFLLNLSPFFIMLILSFYPRIIAVGGRRLNTFQLFFLVLIFFVSLIHIKNIRLKRFFRLFIAFWLISTIISSSFEIKKGIDIAKINQTKLAELKSFPDINNCIVLCSNDILLLPYQLYYFKHRQWGKENLNIRSFHFQSISIFDDGLSFPKIKVERDNKIISISAINRRIVLNYEKEIDDEGIINLYPTFSGRSGYSQIQIDENKINPHNKKIIIYDGLKWKII